MADLAENYGKLWETFNLDETLGSLYTRLNEWVNYGTLASETIKEEKVVRISYGLVAEIGQLQEDYQTWQAKLDEENTWTRSQEHFIEEQADLWECKKTSRQGGYHTGTANNTMDMSVAFANLVQAMAEDCAAVTNLTTKKRTLT